MLSATEPYNEHSNMGGAYLYDEQPASTSHVVANNSRVVIFRTTQICMAVR